MTGIPQLRPYQAEPARAILKSVIARRGLTFTVRMSRQAGKNELSAQLEAALLAIANTGVIPGVDPTIVKTAPTFTPQAKVSIRRLSDTLRAGRIRFNSEDGHIIRVGRARANFLSAEPNANVVGNTAGLLLEVDEAQDVSPDKYDKEFRPMCAAFNATTVLYGTAWSDADLLERERLAAVAAERADGVRRAFDYAWREVARHVPPYADYVDAERTRLGDQHPLFYTQYDLRCVPGAGRLFSPDQLAQLRGEHPRRTTPPPAATIVAGLDLAGGATTPDEAAAHDRTVLTLAAVTPASPQEPIAANHTAILHHITWHGTTHDQLLPQLRDILRTWKVRSVAVDATGVGETIARILEQALGAHVVTPVKFTRASKSALGYQLIEATNTGRLKIYAADPDDEDAATLWTELRLCRANYLPGQLLDFHVEPADGNDDYVVSLALLAHAAANVHPRIARGRSP